MSDSGDLALIVAADDREAMIDYLLGRLAAVDRLLPVRTMWITRYFTEGSRWRLRVLTREQTRVLQAEAGPRPALAGPSPGRADPAGERIVELLAEDGRMAYAEPSERAGMNEPTIRRKVRALLESGRLALRCDLAPQAAGRPVLVTLTARVPADRLEAASRVLAQLPETRLVAGDADLGRLLAPHHRGHPPPGTHTPRTASRTARRGPAGGDAIREAGRSIAARAGAHGWPGSGPNPKL
ncbi:Lrp/AsnC family transcriptional regulator [Streptomyces antibioticus]